MKKYYTVLRDNDDNDWGYGSYNKRTAAKMVRDLRKSGYPDAYIAVIEGSAADAVCTAEIHDVRNI